MVIPHARAALLVISICVLFPACGDEPLDIDERVAEEAGLPEKNVRLSESKIADAIIAEISEGNLGKCKTLLDMVKDESLRSSLSNQINRAQEQEVRSKAADDPRETIRSILDGTYDIEDYWLEVAMDEYMKRENRGAVEWHTSIESELTSEQNDRILLARSRAGLRCCGWREAAKLKDRVINPEIRKVIGDEVGGAIEREIRAKVDDSPNETLEELLGGSTGYEVFWIEVAVDQYIKINAQGSAAWYHENVTRLNPQQLERVALAYARAANHGGDKVLARKWAEQISDCVLRELMVAEIDR